MQKLRQHGGYAKDHARGPELSRRLQLAMLTMVALLLPSSSALAQPVQMVPNPISTGIQDPLAAMTITLTNSSISPISAIVEYEAEGFFIDTCCDYLLDFAFPSAIVTDVETEVLASPAGGTANWANPSGTPIDVATASLTCVTTSEDNLCRYRVRLTLEMVPDTGTIEGIAVAYSAPQPVPMLPGWARVMLVGMMIGVAGLMLHRAPALRGARIGSK